MFTTEQANTAIKIAEGFLTEEQLKRFEDSVRYLTNDIKVGDMVETPRGIFEVKAILDNGNYMPNNFVETNSEYKDANYLFKITDCKLVTSRR